MFLYQRLNPKQADKDKFENWQLEAHLIPDLPVVNEEERKYF
jgi:hypothetical protein